jgi:hypothetical protein
MHDYTLAKNSIKHAYKSIKKKISHDCEISGIIIRIKNCSGEIGKGSSLRPGSNMITGGIGKDQA